MSASWWLLAVGVVVFLLGLMVGRWWGYDAGSRATRLRMRAQAKARAVEREAQDRRDRHHDAMVDTVTVTMRQATFTPWTEPFTANYPGWYSHESEQMVSLTPAEAAAMTDEYRWWARELARPEYGVEFDTPWLGWGQPAPIAAIEARPAGAHHLDVASGTAAQRSWMAATGEWEQIPADQAAPIWAGCGPEPATLRWDEETMQLVGGAQ